MSRRVGLIAVVALFACSQLLLLAITAARAADLPLPPKPAPVPAYKAPAVVALSPFYVGAAFNWTHHTGYVPNSPWSVERYTIGGKVFGGYRFNEVVQFEGAYHYLGLTPSVFARVEYEFLSTAIGGGSQSIPALNSLFHINMGSTNRAINVMHTPLAVTLGMNF